MTYIIKKYKRYKRHYICLSCRKGFKQANEKDMAERKGELSLLLNAFYYKPRKKKIPKDVVQYLKEKYFKNKVTCPECSQKMVQVPMSFQVPLKKKKREWKIVESNYKATGYITKNLPQKKKDFIQYLESVLNHQIFLLQHQAEKNLYETEKEVKTRLRNDIESIRAEIKCLEKEL